MHGLRHVGRTEEDKLSLKVSPMQGSKPNTGAGAPYLLVRKYFRPEVHSSMDCMHAFPNTFSFPIPLP